MQNELQSKLATAADEARERVSGYSPTQKKQLSMWAQFHKLWGQAKEQEYSKDDWMELQGMLESILGVTHIQMSDVVLKMLKELPKEKRDLVLNSLTLQERRVVELRYGPFSN